MLTQDLVDLPVEVFGGYNPALAPTVVPPGASPLAQDCDFPEGAVTTRGGLFNIFGPGHGINPAAFAATINGLKTYLTPQIQRRLMVWDSQGNLYKESPDGTLTLLFSRPDGANTLYQSTTLFGREYQAFYAYADPLLGLDIPRQYDDTNWDRVSQVGPGAAPLAADEISTAYTIANAPNGLTQITAGATLTEVGLIVTATGLAVNPFSAVAIGDLVEVSSVSVSAYNGTYPIIAKGGVGATEYITFAIATPGLAPAADGVVIFPQVNVVLNPAATPFAVGQLVTIAGAGVGGYDATYTNRYNDPGGAFFVLSPGTFALGPSGSGTATNGGSIGIGRHNISVAFITRQGFITQAAPWGFFNAGGSKRVTASQIPIGPSNIIARLLLFTPVITPPAVAGTFYSIPQANPEVYSSAMLIPDNTTTTWTVDFTDVILISSFNAEYLFTQLELGECANANGYNSRMVWCGERNKVTNFVNLTFDGGFIPSPTINNTYLPLGWTQAAATAGFGLSPASLYGIPGDWGDALFIGSSGGFPIVGKITQSAYQDYLNVPILAQNTSYRVRVRLARYQGPITQGTFHINLQSTLQGFTTAGLSVALTALTTNYVEFDMPLTDVPLVTVPSDLQLQVYADGMPAGGGANPGILVDSIEVYPTNQPYNFSTARISHAFNPESYDATTGAVQIRPNDGQMLHASFPLRNNLYFGKDHYLCYVTDDGVNEPSSWQPNEVSATVGICGPNAVDWNEEWAVFAERSGLYIFWGSDPVKITPEVQQDASNTGKVTWNSINWAASQCIWVRIDKVNKQILVGAPIGNATLPNVVFMLDYKWLDGAADIASSPMVTYSAFTGKVLAHGRGRRWMVWNISASAMTFAERVDGTTKPFYGNSIGNGKVYEQLPPQVQPSDDGVAINSFYSTYYSPSHVEEQMVQLGAHQKLLGYLKWRATGVGILSIAIITTRRTTNLRGYILSLNPLGDGERGIEVAGERFSIQVGTNAVGSYFSLEQVVPCLKKHPTMVVRGLNV